MSLEIARKVLEIEADAVRGLIGSLDERFLEAVELIYSCTGRTILSGMGLDPHTENMTNVGRPVKLGEGKILKQLLSS